MMKEKRELSTSSIVVEKYLESCINLGNNFENPPEIRLELITQTPPNQEPVGERDVAVSTAYQCYAPGVSTMKPREGERDQEVADSTLDAGHNTTRLHHYISWKLIGVSRSVTHDLLHANPFYNSEQQSQRYVEAKRGNYLVPADLTGRQKDIFVEAAEFSNGSYFELLDLLKIEAGKRIEVMYPEDGWKVESTTKRLDTKAGKIAQEVARYVLPIGQKTTLDHTLSTLQLLRLFRASTMTHVSDEGRFIVASMIQGVADIDDTIIKELREPLAFDKSDRVVNEEYIRKQKEEFDSELGERQTLLVNPDRRARLILADAVRGVRGIPKTQLSDAEALQILVDPEKNKLLADVYDVGMIDPLTSTLRQASLTFKTRLSHTADSQRQRHRRTPGATPSIELSYDGRADYMTPMIIKENGELTKKYQERMDTIYLNVNNAIASGIPREDALLLLPNAHNIRLQEQGDCFDWIHRWKQRLCLLAQEEICFISIEQVEKLKDILPESDNLLLAPCGIRQRAGIHPRCPEGERWCGSSVWNWEIEEYKNGRLV